MSISLGLKWPYHDHGVGLTLSEANKLEDVVWHVPGDVVNRTGGRVAPDDRGLRVLDSLPRGIVGRMAQVDKHADAVHLVNKPVSEFAKSSVVRCWAFEDTTGVCERVVAGVREGDVAHAEVVVRPQHLNGVSELMAPADLV